jgi:hypothetical protein
VDERADGFDSTRCPAGVFERQVYGAFDAHAETRCFSDKDFHFS